MRVLVNPIVSIIVPLYNKGQYIQANLHAVSQQRESNWELLVVNNASTDGGDRQVAQYFDPRVRLLQCPRQTGGPGLPRNLGLGQAQGSWVLFLDADDLIAPDHLSTLLEETERYPNAQIIAGFWQEFSEAAPEVYHLKQPAGYPEATQAFRQSTIAGAPWACHAALVRREILHPPYCWVEALDPYLSEDTAFWFRLLSRYAVVYSQGAGALYRRVKHARDQHQDPERWFKGIHAVIENNLAFLEAQHLPLTSAHCEALMRRYSDTYLLARRHDRLDIASQCLDLAQIWLDRTIDLGGGKTLPLNVRHRLGLKRFLPLQFWREHWQQHRNHV